MKVFCETSIIMKKISILMVSVLAFSLSSSAQKEGLASINKNDLKAQAEHERVGKWLREQGIL